MPDKFEDMYGLDNMKALFEDKYPEILQEFNEDEVQTLIDYLSRNGGKSIGNVENSVRNLANLQIGLFKVIGKSKSEAIDILSDEYTQMLGRKTSSMAMMTGTGAMSLARTPIIRRFHELQLISYGKTDYAECPYMGTVYLNVRKAVEGYVEQHARELNLID